MPLKIVRLDTAEAAADTAAAIIARQIVEKPSTVLGLATGRTPLPIYDRLTKMHKAGQVSFRNVTTFNLDEYIGLPASHPASFASYMQQTVFDRIDVRRHRTNLLNGTAPCHHEEAATYERRLRKIGPIDLQLLGLGRNGHIGFNEPGSPHDSRTRMVELSASTIEANKDDFASLNTPPRRAITMGIGTMLEATSILIVATGAGKADAVARMLKGEVMISLPASALNTHADVTLLADAAALGSSR
jgi:glucosamine-6-phosphate deaminase